MNTDPVTAALRELVALKDLKDSWEDRAVRGLPPTEADFDYERRQSTAWDAARAALAAPMAVPEPHPCAEGAREDLLDELEDQRLELLAHHGTAAVVLGKAIAWINGEQAASAPLADDLLVGELVAATLAEERAHESDENDREKDYAADRFIRAKDRLLRALAARASLPPQPTKELIMSTVTDEMVSRFLSWRLPADFSPDGGITFKRTYNETSPFGPQEREPIGTNLLSADQARAMLEHVLAATPPPEEARPGAETGK